MSSLDDYRSAAMSGYLVALIEQSGDEHWASTEYVRTVHRLLGKYGGSPIAAGQIEQLEGLPLNETRAAITEVPSTAAVHSFWNDPEYRAVVPLRQTLGAFQMFILPGIDESPGSAPDPNR